MITLDEAIEILSRPKTMKGTPQDILEAHDMAITALRQPKNIRCWECKYGKWDIGDRGMYCGRRYVELGTTEDFFCAAAERREVSK